MDVVVKKIKEANRLYYTEGKSTLTDKEYDALIDKLKGLDPNHELLNSVGDEVPNDSRKEKLPVFMDSLNKYKTDSEIKRWISKYSKDGYVISEKLDGVSGLIVIKDKIKTVYTRGNGLYGQNITHISKNINIPDVNEDICIRGEFIIPKCNYEHVKNLGTNNSMRNVVAGILNSKTLDINKKLIASYIDFVCYEVIDNSLTPEEQIDTLKEYDLNTIQVSYTNKISYDLLQGILINFKDKSKYEIDGIVIKLNTVTDRVIGENRKEAFAFKDESLMFAKETEVTKIEWNISKDGIIVPVVHFNTIELCDTKVSKATGYNAKNVITNKIGVGSIISVMKSGDVIPKIVSVIKPSDKDIMPKGIDYDWDDNEVNIKVNGQNDDKNIKEILNFFLKSDSEHIKLGTVKKLYSAGYVTIKSILNMSVDDIMKIDGFKEKSANNVYSSIQMTKNSDIVTLMTASNSFGRSLGKKKLELILECYPYDKTVPTKDQLLKIKGIQSITADQYLEGIVIFKKFMSSLGLNAPVVKNKTNAVKYKVLFTGVRDKELEEKISDNGGEVASTFSKSIDYLIVPSVVNKKTTKMKEAEKNNIKIVTIDEFKKMGLIH